MSKPRAKQPRVNQEPITSEEMRVLWRAIVDGQNEVALYVSSLRTKVLFGGIQSVPRDTIERFLTASGQLKDALDNLEGRLPD